MKPPVRSTQKTYWHLLGRDRAPTEYEIVSSRLLYYVQSGFEIDLPMKDWYERFQRGSRFGGVDWERFNDPRETTYAEYTKLRNTRETYLDGLLASVERRSTDGRLAPSWVHAFDRFVAPMLYPCHGLQMASAYVGSMSPSGKIAIACLFQTGDEIRRIQRIAQRIAAFRGASPRLGASRLTSWRHDPSWQPLRRTIEKLLVTYDWGECFVALNLVVKPILDELWTIPLAELAAAEGDDALSGILLSLGEDAAWHREWSLSLVRTACENAGNRTVAREWIEAWLPPAVASAMSLMTVAGRYAFRNTSWTASVPGALARSYRGLLERSDLFEPKALDKLLLAWKASPAIETWRIPVERPDDGLLEPAILPPGAAPSRPARPPKGTADRAATVDAAAATVESAPRRKDARP